MARPESITDIELEDVEFATFDPSKIATDGTILKAYATFLEAMQKAGAVVSETSYRGVTFYRRPSDKEQQDQLRQKQASWDYRKKEYDTLAAVGELEHGYMESQVREWATGEGLPYPPPHEPISDFHATIRAIDDAVEA